MYLEIKGSPFPPLTEELVRAYDMSRSLIGQAVGGTAAFKASKDLEIEEERSSLGSANDYPEGRTPGRTEVPSGFRGGAQSIPVVECVASSGAGRINRSKNQGLTYNVKPHDSICNHAGK